MVHAIHNFDTLAKDSSRRDALAIAEAGFTAIHTGAALTRKLRIEGNTLHVDDTAHPLLERRIFFVGIGKCALPAAEAVEKIFGNRLTRGIVLCPTPPEQPTLSRIDVYIGTHPLPTEANELATKRIIALLSECIETDLVLMLISGGGSTLICQNEAPMTCADEASLFTELTACGATIQDMNTVRKHTSIARGGGLAKAAYPAEVISLIVSDVPGDDIQYISSGPTVLDTSTIADAEAILAKYHLTPEKNVTFVETPKEEKYYERVANVLFLTNQDALLAMQSEATRRGYTVAIMENHFSGEASDIGRTVANALHTAPPKTVLLYAGESTVTLGARHGKGGRNQEIALSALSHIQPDELVLPFASDGHDNTEYAGALADVSTLEHARAHDLSIETSLAEHCSYNFFTATGDALMTGYTGSNVSDLIIAIKK